MTAAREPLAVSRHAAAAFAGLAVAWFAACDATVISGIDEAQANELLVALDRAGVSAAKAREEGTADPPRYRVSVASDDVARALVVLREAELPRRTPPGIVEVFGEGGLVPTPTEERARLAAALGGELGRSIAAIDGVLDARVHVAVPEVRDVPLDGAAPRPRASVLVRARPDAAFDEAAVRALVSGAVAGLMAEDVAVVVSRVPTRMQSAPSELVRIGPVAVSRGTAGAARALVAGSALLNVAILGGALLYARRLKRRVEEAEAEAKRGADTHGQGESSDTP
jgi:type III secretion protein J